MASLPADLFRKKGGELMWDVKVVLGFDNQLERCSCSTSLLLVLTFSQIGVTEFPPIADIRSVVEQASMPSELSNCWMIMVSSPG